MQSLLEAIRRKSDHLPVTPDPILSDFVVEARICQLYAMLEIIKLLSDNGIEIPAIVDGGVRAEIDRLREAVQ